MHRSRLVLLLPFLFPLGVCAIFNCSDVSISNRHFDLSPALQGDINESKIIPSLPFEIIHHYRVNPCHPLLPKEECSDPDAWGCLVKSVRKKDNGTTVFAVNNIIQGQSPLPIINFTGGKEQDDVGSTLSLTYDGKLADGQLFQTVIQMECSKETSPWEIVEYICPARVVIKFRSPSVCPKTASSSPIDTPSGTGGGVSFLTILFILFVVYMLIGTLYRRFVLKLEGIDQIPHYHFWIEIPSLFMELFHFIKAKVTGSQRGYIQV